jgi:hypothetical protein
VDGALHTWLPGSGLLTLVGRAKTAGVDVILTGEGSEFALDSAPGVFAEYMARSPTKATNCLLQFDGVREARIEFTKRMLKGILVGGVLPKTVIDLRRRTQRRFCPDWAGEELRRLLRRPFLDVRPTWSYGQRSRITNLASAYSLMSLVDHMGRWEIATGVRFAFPYLDDGLLAFLARVPSSAIFAGARERGLLREALEDFVPDSLRYRQDKGEAPSAALEQYVASGGTDSVREFLDVRELARLGLVNPARFQRSFHRMAGSHPGASVAEWQAVWGAVAAEAYVRWFLEFRAGSSAGPQQGISSHGAIP